MAHTNVDSSRNTQPLQQPAGLAQDQRVSVNAQHPPVAINRQMRQQLKGHAGKVVWFTGLSGSGKSTLAHALELQLHTLGRHTYVLDGDNIRQGLNKDLGFSDTDRVENIRRITEVAQLMFDAGLIVIVAFISPFRRERDMARERIGAPDFIEVHMSAALEICEARDIKGLYHRARSGQLPNMTGVGSVYEAPLHPELRIDSNLNSISAAVELLLHALSAVPGNASDAAGSLA